MRTFGCFGLATFQYSAFSNRHHVSQYDSEEHLHTCICNEILILISFFKLGQTFSFFTAVNDYQKAKNINEHLHKVGRCNNFWIFLYNFRQMKKSLYVRI